MLNQYAHMLEIFKINHKNNEADRFYVDNQCLIYAFLSI